MYLYADQEKDEQLPLIREAWEYMKHCSGGFEGMVKHQVDWMEKNCSFLKHELDEGPDNEPKPQGNSRGGGSNMSLIGTGDNAAFLTSEGEGLWNKLRRLFDVPKSIKKIVIAAPYFDWNGLFLQELQQYFQHADIRVLTERESDLLPVRMPLSNRILFHEWSSSEAGRALQFKDNPRMLHGKLICLSGADGNYLVIGSANPTDKAYLRSSGGNKEAVLVMRSKEKDWQALLGLTVEGDPFTLPKERQEEEVQSRDADIQRLYEILCTDSTFSHLYAVLGRGVAGTKADFTRLFSM